MEWMENYLDGTKAEQTALGMIKIDIAEHGFENWLNLPAIPIVEWYVTSTEEVADQLIEDYRSVKGVEDIIGDSGIGQSYRLKEPESLVAFKDGIMDIVNSMLIYLTTQEMASAYYAEHTN
jgi:hypothetical protein|tara:strand:- start:38 stop:400 length:363 start_codon:yes stop_codon:yes gene_type:complete